MKNINWLMVLSAALALQAGLAVAQPNEASPNQFGDRQAGHFGDNGAGHFGDPAAGNFDNANLKEPPPGTVPQGKVYRKSAVETSEYLSLPAAQEEPSAAVAKPVAKAKKKRVKSRKKAQGQKDATKTN